MKIAILQPTPFRKGHYFIYTKSLFDKIYSYGKKVKIGSHSWIGAKSIICPGANIKKDSFVKIGSIIK